MKNILLISILGCQILAGSLYAVDEKSQSEQINQTMAEPLPEEDLDWITVEPLPEEDVNLPEINNFDTLRTTISNFIEQNIDSREISVLEKIFNAMESVIFNEDESINKNLSAYKSSLCIFYIQHEFCCNYCEHLSIWLKKEHDYISQRWLNFINRFPIKMFIPIFILKSQFIHGDLVGNEGINTEEYIMASSIIWALNQIIYIINSPETSEYAKGKLAEFVIKITESSLNIPSCSDLVTYIPSSVYEPLEDKLKEFTERYYASHPIEDDGESSHENDNENDVFSEPDNSSDSP
ncbi:MAG: hypothetical protein LBI37_02970 [Puniceicoccales bacterium]|nr:hypothetical protein [Puniceicoccales bacterium]